MEGGDQSGDVREWSGLWAVDVLRRVSAEGEGDRGADYSVASGDVSDEFAGCGDSVLLPGVRECADQDGHKGAFEPGHRLGVHRVPPDPEHHEVSVDVEHPVLPDADPDRGGLGLHQPRVPHPSRQTLPPLAQEDQPPALRLPRPPLLLRLQQHLLAQHRLLSLPTLRRILRRHLPYIPRFGPGSHLRLVSRYQQTQLTHHPTNQNTIHSYIQSQIHSTPHHLRSSHSK